jgi:flagellar biogenesis protein FliO
MISPIPSPCLALAESQLMRYWIVVGALLGALFLASFLIKRLGLRHKLMRSVRRSFEVLDVLPVGKSQRLCVVRCYDRTFLIGVGDRELCSVAELDQAVVENDRSKELARAASPGATGRRAFSEWLGPLARVAPAAAKGPSTQGASAPGPAVATAAGEPAERAARQRVAQDLLARLGQSLPELEVAPSRPGRSRETGGLGRGGVLG